jgi:hypothetical protein
MMVASRVAPTISTSRANSVVGRYPEATFRILAEIESGALPELLAEMEAYEDVTELDVLNDPDER